MASFRGNRLHVLITEPHNILRRGLRHLLEERREVEAVHAVRTGAEALSAIRAILYDVVVVDLRLPDGDGVELARRLRACRSGVRVVILAEGADRPAVMRAMSAGVHGFLPMAAEEKDLVAAVVEVARGKKPFDPAAMQSFVRDSPPRPRLDRVLTAQERLVLILLAQGFSDHEIAERAGLAEQSVRSHVSSALLKLGVRESGDLPPPQALDAPRSVSSTGAAS